MHDPDRAYKSTIAKEYDITMSQLEAAIQDGVLTAHEVKNPHYRTGPPSLLLSRAEVTLHLETITRYPKTSASQRAQQQVNAARSRLRTAVSFFCTVCDTTIRARRDSTAFVSFVDGMLSEAETIILLRGAHERHTHTTYDHVRRARYASLRKAGEEQDEAYEQARAVALEQARKV